MSSLINIVTKLIRPPEWLRRLSLVPDQLWVRNVLWLGTAHHPMSIPRHLRTITPNIIQVLMFLDVEISFSSSSLAYR
jgi:hypothetical protein